MGIALDVLLVIPAYCEEDRLPGFLDELIPMLSPLPTKIGLLIVDDGSPISSQKKLQNYLSRQIKNAPHLLLEPLYLKENLGKGGAIASGWSTDIKAKWLAFVDADGAVPPYEIKRLIQLIKKIPPHTAIFASRIKMLGKKIDRTLLRHLLGRVFATSVGTLINENVYDTQCGFKIIPYASWQKMKHLVQEKSFAFDVELLALLEHMGISVQEEPIDWRDIAGSKVNVLDDGIKMFQAIIRLRQRKKEW
ncbi:MAG: glycosyltransferase [Verrucomicrobiota bacterium]